MGHQHHVEYRKLKLHLTLMQVVFYLYQPRIKQQINNNQSLSVVRQHCRKKMLNVWEKKQKQMQQQIKKNQQRLKLKIKLIRYVTKLKSSLKLESKIDASEKEKVESLLTKL